MPGGTFKAFLAQNARPEGSFTIKPDQLTALNASIY